MHLLQRLIFARTVFGSSVRTDEATLERFAPGRGRRSGRHLRLLLRLFFIRVGQGYYFG